MFSSPFNTSSQFAVGLYFLKKLSNGYLVICSISEKFVITSSLLCRCISRCVQVLALWCHGIEMIHDHWELRVNCGLCKNCLASWWSLSRVCVVQPSWSLKDVGLTDLGIGQLDELVDRLLPCVTQDVSSKPLRGESHPWKTSYLSTDSFFHNRYGERDTDVWISTTGCLVWACTFLFLSNFFLFFFFPLIFFF